MGSSLHGLTARMHLPGVPRLVQAACRTRTRVVLDLVNPPTKYADFGAATMTKYEAWSLALTAIGHLFVGLSVLYAARQWIVSKRSYEREILRDTRAYLSKIGERIHSYHEEIIEKSIDPDDPSPSIDDWRPVTQLLNTLEGLAYEVEVGFYDPDMLEKFLTAHSAQAWARWKQFVHSRRETIGHANLWTHLELATLRYKQENSADG